MSKFTIVGDNSPGGIIRHWERKTKQECAREILKCWEEIERLKSQGDKITQVSGFGVSNTVNTQCDYMLTAVTASGKVLMSTGDGVWADVTGDAYVK